MKSNHVIEVQRMAQSAEVATRFLKVLANPDRLMLMCRLSEGECNVGQLEEDLDIHQPTLSQQLGVLREEGLVSTRRDGKHIFYTLASPESLAVMHVLQQQFCKTPR
jgi:DNA-binding transcriptional ArsR family regulator